ncbi:MAG: hypothetical protein SGI91_03900 [Alphaproteobacteria bacterium]|nr:hypothetical protein [Alphaproteobacteria bacterium]
MRALGIILFALIALVTAAQTAPNTGSPTPGGSGGVDYKCNALTRKCSCKGNWEGAHCQAMQKNCDLSKARECSTNPPYRCTCTLSASYRNPRNPHRPSGSPPTTRAQ